MMILRSRKSNSLTAELLDENGGKLNRADVFSTDPIRQYLRSIGKITLLKPHEEIAVAKRIKAGKAVKKEHKSSSRLTAVEEKILQDSELAREQMIKANLRLVVSIAKRYQGRGLDFLELVQEGNIGLFRAVEKFDLSKGYKFSTYGTHWIMQSITRAIADQGRAVRLPVHMVEKVNRVKVVERRLVQELGREPKPEEIGIELGMTAEAVIDNYRVSQEIVSLETPVGEGDTTLGNYIPDDEEKNVPPEESAVAFMLRKDVQKLLNSLTDREKRIIELRFGLKDGHPRTLAEVGDVFGVTRERIRQIEAKAMDKLRMRNRSSGMNEYLRR